MKYDISIHANPDARAWAKFFCETNKAANLEMMTAWFANAMMAMHDHIKGIKAINGDHLSELIK